MKIGMINGLEFVELVRWRSINSTLAHRSIEVLFYTPMCLCVEFWETNTMLIVLNPFPHIHISYSLFYFDFNRIQPRQSNQFIARSPSWSIIKHWSYITFSVSKIISLGEFKQKFFWSVFVKVHIHNLITLFSKTTHSIPPFSVIKILLIESL